MTLPRLGFAGLLFLLVPLACATGAPPGPSAEETTAPRLATAPLGDLVEQWIVSSGNLFLKRPRPDFAAYRSLRVEVPALYFEDHTTPPIAQDQAMLKRGFQAVLIAQVTKAIGLPAGNARGPGVLRVRGEANDLELDRARSGNSRVTSIIQPSGNVFFVLELADDVTGEPLVRFAMRRPLPGGIYTGPWWPDLDRARLLFRTFAADAHENLAIVFGSGPSSS